MSKVILVMGYPASGKSTLSNELAAKGYVHLNRDKAGGKTVELVPQMQQALKDGNDVVLDNTFPTVASRKPFIDAAKAAGAEIDCKLIDIKAEDAQINALQRMWQRHQKIFWAPEDLKGVKSPNIFPIVVIFKYKKEYEKPTTGEGFASVDVHKFKRERGQQYKNKAILLDYDGTLRDVPAGSQYKYPIKVEEVVPLPNRTEKLKQCVADGYRLLGVSNQSGIAKKYLSQETATACFERTNTLLDAEIEFLCCPHGVPPRCYCRKPQMGIGVHFIEKYKLDPAQCIMVGDQTTDKTFAKRLGLQYQDQADFFKG